MGWEDGVNKKFSEAPQFYGLYSLLIFLGAGIVLLPGIPLFPVIYVSQVINGIVLPVILIGILVLINDKKIMGNYVNKGVFNFISWATVIILIGSTETMKCDLSKQYVCREMTWLNLNLATS